MESDRHELINALSFQLSELDEDELVMEVCRNQYQLSSGGGGVTLRTSLQFIVGPNRKTTKTKHSHSLTHSLQQPV